MKTGVAPTAASPATTSLLLLLSSALPLADSRELGWLKMSEAKTGDTVDNLMVVETEAAEEVLIHLVVLQRLAHLVKESIV